uniref:Uncharacterized protein n=1 Tax=Setaria italica TaxID=4555 RepID=K3YXD7_SETIT
MVKKRKENKWNRSWKGLYERRRVQSRWCISLSMNRARTAKIYTNWQPLLPCASCSSGKACCLPMLNPWEPI